MKPPTLSAPFHLCPPLIHADILHAKNVFPMKNMGHAQGSPRVLGVWIFYFVLNQNLSSLDQGEKGT